MHLRNLEEKDAPFMLEWMHDDSVVEHLNHKFATKTLDDCLEFINTSISEKNIHLAIASDADEYMGTVSLRNINNDNSEFAITVRQSAMGKGYAWFGMKGILKKAFEELNLNSVYWCVSLANDRAIRFYKKHGFKEILDVPLEFQEKYDKRNDLIWFSTLKGDDIEIKQTIAGCRTIRIKTIPTVNSGELSFFESNNDIPFDIKRVYYITKVSEGVRRGFHAHKNLKQLLFCPYGRIQLTLESEYGREEVELSDPSVGIIIEKCTWREMVWLQKDSVLCVAASDYYDSNDYIRDYDEFRNYVSKEK